MSKSKAVTIDCPDNSNVVTSICYGVVSLVVAPYLLSFFSLGFELDRNAQAWVQFVYYTINCVAMVIIFREYLQDTFFYIRMDFRSFIPRVADGTVLMLIVSAVIYGIGYRIENPLIMQGIIPTVEIDLLALPSVLMDQQPIVAVFCLVLVTPVTTSLLYFGTGIYTDGTYFSHSQHCQWLDFLAMGRGNDTLPCATTNPSACLLYISKSRFHLGANCYAYDSEPGCLYRLSAWCMRKI